jgi:hypothetical protein
MKSAVAGETPVEEQPEEVVESVDLPRLRM